MMRQLSQLIAKFPQKTLQLMTSGLLVLNPLAFSVLLMQPVQAEPNFGTIELPAAANETVEGYTAGSVPLFAILNSPEDDQSHPCVGYADQDPDHILVVSQTLSNVVVAVDSNGGDTTLMIEGPDQVVYCGDDGNGSDAIIRGRNWSNGRYKVWVGTFDAGEHYDYTLEIRQ